jgi:MFS family permease
VINYIDREVVFAIFPLLQRDLRFSPTQLGLAGTLFTWTYSLFMPVAGRLADVIQRRWMVCASLVLWSIATLGTAFSYSVTQFLFWRVVMGITEALYVPAAIALITDTHPGGTRSRALSIHGLAQFAGITIGGWFGGWAGEHNGWRAGFALLAALGISYSAVLFWRFQALRPQAEVAQKSSGSPRAVFQSRCYVGLCLVFFSFCAMLWVLYTWLPTHVYETFHVSLAESGFVATAYLQVSSAAGTLAGGFAGDALSRRQRAGRFYVTGAGLLLCAPFAVAAFQTQSLTGLKLCACGFGWFAGFLMANVVSSAYDVIAPREFGLATGVLNMTGGLGSGVAVLLAGVFKDSLGIAGILLYFALAAMALSFVLWAVVAKRFETERCTASLRSLGAPVLG